MGKQCHIQNSICTEVLEIAKTHRDDILPMSPVCFPSMSGSNRQESSGLQREGGTGRWGGNEGTETITEKTNGPTSQDAMGLLTTVGSWEVQLPRLRVARKHLQKL